VRGREPMHACIRVTDRDHITLLLHRSYTGVTSSLHYCYTVETLLLLLLYYTVACSFIILSASV
jgi:hypothetical protein